MRDELVVYWSPMPFELNKESWNLLYPEPVNLYADLVEKTDASAPIRFCPATKSNMKRTFSFNSSIEDVINFDTPSLKDFDDNSADGAAFPYNSKVSLTKLRKSSYPDHINVGYNLGWHFFCEEPVVAKMTAPYFPATSPTEKALFATGEFDIGQWFRPFNLDYHIPYSSKSFKINIGDPLFFLELATDKKIVFKRFIKNERITNIGFELSNSPKRYGVFQKISQKYDMFNKSKIREILLKEIKKELVE